MIHLSNVDRVFDFVHQNPGCRVSDIQEMLGAEVVAWSEIIDADRYGRIHCVKPETGVWAFYPMPEALADYRLSPRGVVTSPGKFEGEHGRVVLAFDAWLEGFAGEDAEGVMFADVEWLGETTRVHFYVDDQGFVKEVR